MPTSNPLLWRRPPAIWGYAIAVLSVISILMLSRSAALHLEAAPVSLFLCAVILSAWFGGIGPWLLATALATLSFYYYFLPPAHSLGPKPLEIPRLVVFIVSSLFVGALSAAQRKSTESLRRARDELRGAVGELRNSNEALQAESHERNSAEQSLRRSEGYLAEAQRLSHTGSWARVAATGEMSYWSEECFRVLGFDPQGGPPSFEAFLQRVHPDDQPKLRQITESAFREGVGYEFDYRIVRPGGDVRDIEVVGHPVLGPSGHVVEFVGTVMDVTEQRRAEEERERLRQAQAELAHINRVTTMGELTASLAHEVNQPIAAAVTNANACLRWLTRDQPDVEEARAAAMRIAKDGTRAAEIIKRIRLLFKKGTAERELVDVNEVIREMTILLRGEAAQSDVSVKAELATDLPQVMADRVQLQQVLMNLMLNGVDSMKAVNGARELTIKSERGENDKVLVSVSDTGAGLPAEKADQIFQAFFTTKPQGTGMGLSISRSIVESHGGRIWADGNSPRGASFCFSLPAKAEPLE